MMKAVIQAGGKGTRLAQYTRELPKPLLEIGDKSILEHQIDLLKRYGIKDIIIIVNHLKKMIIDRFGNGKTLGVSIQYFEEKHPLGTVGGIKEIEHLLTEDFIVFYSDIMVNMNLQRFIKFHKNKNSICTLVLHPNDHPYDSDLIEIDKDQRIIAVHPKPHEKRKYYKNLVNAGVYIFSPLFLKHLEKSKKADFGKDIFPVIYKNIKMFGYNTFEYLKDTGTPERLEQVNTDYKSGKIHQLNFEKKQKAIFMDRDGVTNVEKDLIYRPEDMELFSFTAEAIREINKSDYLSVIVSNQSVIARNLCTIDELEYIHKKIETELGNEHSKLDAIYYCPHHPDKGYPEERAEYKIDCECRKPKTGMFRQAANDFNIDLSMSWMIGDAERDIIAGKNAGCKTVGVMTGYGVKKTSVRPEFFFKDLLEAVRFIVNEPYLEISEKIYKLFSERKNEKPFIISIAGNAKSGKSNFASYICHKFALHGLKVLKVELDNWILPEVKRDSCKNVYDRFRINDLLTDLAGLLAGRKIRLLSYPNHPQRQAQTLEYRFKDEDIIIIEGIVALSREELRNIPDLKIFLKIDARTFKDRIKEYYYWRGKNDDEIKLLLEKREKDEYQLIEKESKFANFVINSSIK
jgi:D,D-heptose 1,7-bisphosphate phosphatase